MLISLWRLHHIHSKVWIFENYCRKSGFRAHFTKILDNEPTENQGDMNSMSFWWYYWDETINKLWKLYVCRDHVQNMANPAISLVVYNLIPLLIGPPAWSKGTQLRGTDPVTVTGHESVTEPKVEHFRGRNLGMIPNWHNASATIKCGALH